jgi:hypothetical protein
LKAKRLLDPNHSDPRDVSFESLKDVGKIVIVSGRGQRILDDRMYVRDYLENLMKDPLFPCVLQDVTLYTPSEVFNGKEIFDTPGTGTCDPEDWSQLNAVLRRANAVVAVTSKSLDEVSTAADVLKACRAPLFHKCITSPEHCSLIAFSSVEEKAANCTASALLRDREDSESGFKAILDKGRYFANTAFLQNC